MSAQEQCLQFQSPVAIAHKTTLKKLGIAQTSLGFIFLIIQIIVVAVYATQYGTLSNTSTYSGFFDSIFIIISGSLGIGAGGLNATACLINTHMGFGIVSAILCMCSFGYGVFVLPSLFSVLGSATFSEHDYQSILILDLIVLFVTIISFVGFILFVVSATYCCKATSALGYRGCCGGCCGETPVTYATVNVTHATQLSGQGFSQPPTLQFDQGYTQPNNYSSVPPQYDTNKISFEPLPDELPLKM